MAEELLLKETLNYHDVEALVGSPQHGQKQLIEPLPFEAEINEQAGIAAGRSQQQSPPLPEDYILFLSFSRSKCFDFFQCTKNMFV